MYGLRRLLGLVIGFVVGAGVVWFITQRKALELSKKVQLLEDQVYELRITFEDDLNTIREEGAFLYKKILELRKATLTPEVKLKVEKLITDLDQICQLGETEGLSLDFRYRV